MIASNVLSVLLAILASACSHKCVHDEVASRSPLHVVSLKQERKPRDLSFHRGPIRITTHLINKYISRRHRARLQQDDPLQKAVKQLELMLQVEQLTMLHFPPQCSQVLPSSSCLLGHVSSLQCGSSPIIDIPLDHMSQMRVCTNQTETNCTLIGGGVPSTDVIVYVTAINHRACGKYTLAYSSHCVLDNSSNNRPVAGVINICAKNFWRSSNNEKYQYKVLLHELTHILVFSDQLYSYFPNIKDNVAIRSFFSGREISKMITPMVINWGRLYFNCDKLEGVPLQSSDIIGLLGSHWSHLHLEDEYMSPVISQLTGEVKAVSNFTLSLFEDSGWYHINYKNTVTLWPQPNKYKGRGCGAVIDQCPDSCKKKRSHFGCAHNGLASASCDHHTLSLGCASYQAVTQYACTDVTRKTLANHNRQHEMLGNQSRCFVFHPGRSSVDRAQYGYCLKFQCYQTSHTHLYALQIFVPTSSTPCCYGDNGGQCSHDYEWVWCRKGVELKLPYLFGHILCPDTDDYCSHSNNVISTDATPPPLCDDSCATCFNPFDPAQCTSCHYGYKLNGASPTTCLPWSTTCWGSSYYDNTTNSCEGCPRGCDLCSSLAHCHRCSDSTHYLTNGMQVPASCVDSCKEAGLHSSINPTNQRRHCYACSDKNCVQCTIDRCVKCQVPYSLLHGHCVPHCPNGSVLAGNVCEPCPNYCIKCTTPTTCVSCEHGFKLATGYCVKKCPSTFYHVNSTHCDRCSRGCVTCNKPSNCKLCIIGYHSYQRHCVKKCPSGYISASDPIRRQLYCRRYQGCHPLDRLLQRCT
ncbi:leishmanolysin-like peptidase isoform X2 [Dysidea avara]|uniref:leishmanolysin-like peptidase isoform X2 n=1 Tax=Dysidea avara TaxID=196820 RepID=UPI003322A67A